MQHLPRTASYLRCGHWQRHDHLLILVDLRATVLGKEGFRHPAWPALRTIHTEAMTGNLSNLQSVSNWSCPSLLIYNLYLLAVIGALTSIVSCFYVTCVVQIV